GGLRVRVVRLRLRLRLRLGVLRLGLVLRLAGLLGPDVRVGLLPRYGHGPNLPAHGPADPAGR
ncbi:hypothetical protein GL263_17590, partial [Streptomyces durbertensis]